METSFPEFRKEYANYELHPKISAHFGNVLKKSKFNSFRRFQKIDHDDKFSPKTNCFVDQLCHHQNLC